MRVGELKRALEGIDETLEIEVCTKGGPLDGEPDVGATIAKAYVFAELDDEGDALPYGIYDLAANHGYLFIGRSHDTAAFAVDNVARW